MARVPAWVCPDCARQFGRVRQGHDCEPAMTLEEYFSSGPPHERPVFDAVMARLDGIGPIHVEPVSVGIFLKRARTFSELRPMTKWVAVSFGLPRRLRSNRMSRKPYETPRGAYHWVNVHTPDEVDDELVEWLIEAYFASPE